MSGQCRQDQLSMRIITTEHSLQPPIPHLDVTTSSFRKTNTRRVPVIHLFGTTTDGERMSMHVHGVFPYVYVPLEFEPDEEYLQKLAKAIDKAMNVSLGRPTSYTQHVFNISIVHGIPYYGFHHKTSVFLKIYMYNAMLMSRLSDLLLSGAIMSRSYQPHEAHIPYMLQFFIDYNLYGMNYINVSACIKRQPADDEQGDTTAAGTSEDATTSAAPADTSQHSASASQPVYKVSTCKLEVDVLAADILNKQLIDDHVGTNPGLLALWEDERKRLRTNNLEDEVVLEAPSSPGRCNSGDVGVHSGWYERFLNMVDALDIASGEDGQSFALPSSGEVSSLNLSGFTDVNDEVDEHSISQMLNFNANLTQAAEHMSCRQLAALLANQSDSEEEEEYISYSPRVSPVKGAKSAQKDVTLTYSPVLSPQPPSDGEVTLTDTTLPSQQPSVSPAPSGVSEERSMSVLSGSSFTSQASRRSRSSLYKWSKKWSQDADTVPTTRSPIPILSQSKSQIIDQSPSGSQISSQSQNISEKTVLSGSDTVRSVPSHAGSVYDTSLFSEEGEDEEWWADIGSGQPTTSAFDDLYEIAINQSGESEDEELETTLMTQPVWEGADDNIDSEYIPQLDGAHDDDEDQCALASNQFESSSSTFQVSNQKNPLKLTLKKSISNCDTVEQESITVNNPLKMKFRRTSATTYSNNPVINDEEPPVTTPVNMHLQEQETSKEKPKITLNFKSLTEKMKDLMPKKKKHKDKDKSHKKERHKSKKSKTDKSCRSPLLAPTPTVSKDSAHVGINFSSKTSVDADPIPLPKQSSAMRESESVLSSIPKLTFAKKGNHFTIKQGKTVSPLKLKISQSVTENNSVPKSSSLKSPSQLTKVVKSPPPSAKCSKSPLNSPVSKVDLLSDLTMSSSDEEPKTKNVMQANQGSTSVGATNESHTVKQSSVEPKRLLSSRPKPAIKLDRHGKFTVSKERSVNSTNPSLTRNPNGKSKTLSRPKDVRLKNKDQGTISFKADKVLSESKMPAAKSSKTLKKPKVGAQKPICKMLNPKPAPQNLTNSKSSAGLSEESLKKSSSLEDVARHSVVSLNQPILASGAGNSYDLDMHMSGQLLGNNTSVFPQPIPVIEASTSNTAFPKSTKTTESLPQSGPSDSIKSNPSSQILVAKSPTTAISSKKTDDSNQSVEAKSTRSILPSPDQHFLQSMNLQRVSEKPPSKVEDQPIERNFETDPLSLHADAFPLQPLTASLSPAPAKIITLNSTAPENLVPEPRSESEEHSQSGLYKNFLKTKLGQQQVSISPSQRSFESLDNSSANIFDSRDIYTPIENSPASVISSQTSHISGLSQPLSLSDKSQPSPSQVSHLEAQSFCNADTELVPQPIRSTHPTQATLASNEAPRVQHGLFRKKKTNKSKHSHTQKRPHGCRNVPSANAKLNHPHSIPISSQNTKLSLSLPPCSADNNESRDPIRLTLKKLKSPVTDNTHCHDFVSLASSVQAPSKIPLGQDTSLKKLVCEGYSASNLRNVHEKKDSFDENSSCTVESNLRVKSAISESEKPKNSDDKLIPSTDTKQDDSISQPTDDTFFVETLPNAAVNDEVVVNGDNLNFQDDVSESDSASLPKPRSFVDRLSQLSQVLGVAPSDRLLEELPIDLPPVVRRDKLGRRLKRGKGRNAWQPKSPKPVAISKAVKRRPRIKSTGTTQHRSERPKRAPSRFRDEAVAEANISVKHDVKGNVDKCDIAASVDTESIDKPKFSITVKQSRVLTRAKNGFGQSSQIPAQASNGKNNSVLHGPASNIVEHNESVQKNQVHDKRSTRHQSNQSKLKQLQSRSSQEYTDASGSSNNSTNSLRPKRMLNRLVTATKHSQDPGRPEPNENIKSSSLQKDICKTRSTVPNQEHFTAVNEHRLDKHKCTTRASNPLQRESRRLVQKSKYAQKSSRLSAIVQKSKQLVLRSSHLPSENDGRVTLTLRRSVLLQRDNNDQSDGKSDTLSVTSKSSRKRTSLKPNRVLEFHANFEALYSFESDGYAPKISLKGSKTIKPSANHPLTKPPVSKSHSAAHFPGTETTKTIQPTVVGKSGKSRALPLSQNALSIQNRGKPSKLTKSKVPITASSAMLATSQNSNAVISSSPSNTPVVSGNVTISKSSPVCAVPTNLSQKSIRPAIQMEVKPVRTQEIVSKLAEPRKLAPRQPFTQSQRVLAPKPSASAPVPQSNMVIIIPSAPIPSIGAPPSQKDNHEFFVPSESIQMDHLSVPQHSVVTHGFQAPSDLPNGKSNSNSRVQVKSLPQPISKLNKGCAAKVSPLKTADQVTESSNEPHQLTRTSRLRSTRATRNIKGIVEEKDLMLKRFLAMPELTLPNKRSRLAPASISNISVNESYCENAKNDWQVSYDNALQSAAILSDDDTANSHSVKVVPCEIGDSSYHTDESRAENDCVYSPQKVVPDQCTCLDCSVTRNINNNGSTLLAQGLQSSSSITKVLHPSSMNLWKNVYDSWRDEEHCSSNCSVDGEKIIDQMSQKIEKPLSGLPQDALLCMKSQSRYQMRLKDNCVSQLSTENVSPTSSKCAAVEVSNTSKPVQKNLQLILKSIAPVLAKLNSPTKLSITMLEFESAMQQLAVEQKRCKLAQHYGNIISEHIPVITSDTAVSPVPFSAVQPSVVNTNFRKAQCTLSSTLGIFYSNLSNVDIIPEVVKVTGKTRLSQDAAVVDQANLSYVSVQKQSIEVKMADEVEPENKVLVESDRVFYDNVGELGISSRMEPVISKAPTQLLSSNMHMCSVVDPRHLVTNPVLSSPVVSLVATAQSSVVLEEAVDFNVASKKCTNSCTGSTTPLEALTVTEVSTCMELASKFDGVEIKSADIFECIINTASVDTILQVPSMSPVAEKCDRLVSTEHFSIDLSTQVSGKIIDVFTAQPIKDVTLSMLGDDMNRGYHESCSITALEIIKPETSVSSMRLDTSHKITSLDVSFSNTEANVTKLTKFDATDRIKSCHSADYKADDPFAITHSVKKSSSIIDGDSLPLNLSVKPHSSGRWTMNPVQEELMPIDLSLKRKRSSPLPHPINLSVKRKARLTEPALGLSGTVRPVAIRLEQHFGVVEGPSSAYVQENGECVIPSERTSDGNKTLLSRTTSSPAAPLSDYFSNSQTDGAGDSPESPDQKMSCSDVNQLSPSSHPPTTSKVIPHSSADTDSDETIWSNISHQFDIDLETGNDVTDKDIIYGTPPEDSCYTRPQDLVPDQIVDLEPTVPQPIQPSTSTNAVVEKFPKTDEGAPLYTSVKRFKPHSLVMDANTKSLRYIRPPPTLAEVQSTAVDLGLSLVDNVYPYFSNSKDCEKALADPMSRNCNKRFADRCVKHLPKVALHHGSENIELDLVPKVERFEPIKLPPSRKSVEKWLTDRTKSTTVEDAAPPVALDESTISQSSGSSICASQSTHTSLAASVDIDIVVAESPPHDVTGHSVTGHYVTGHSVTGHSVTGHSVTDRESRPTSKASVHSRVSERGERASRTSHHHLFSTQIIQSLNEAESGSRTHSSMSSRRSSAFGDKPTDERSLLATQSLRLSQSEVHSYSPILRSPHSEQSANITTAWSGDKSSIEGMSGRDVAAETRKVLKQMASHNTAYNDMITMSVEIHVSTRGSLCPDPMYDRVEAMFIHVHHDTSTRDTFHYVLLLSDGSCQQVPVFLLPGVTVSVVQSASESKLLEELVKLVRKHDPDLLIGWEVHNLSWGYLLRRAQTIQVNLANDLSRIPKPPTNLNQSLQEPTIHNTEFARVGGRVLVNMWKVMRHQMGLGLIPALTNYHFENVVYHILNLRVPKFTYQDLTQWYHLPKKRQLVLDYYLRQVRLLHDMEQQIDFIGQTSEFARVYGIEFCDVIIKGSQYKVESMMLRIGKPLNFVAVSPNVQQRVRMNPPECIPLTLEPESQFYADPVIVLDFQSLYPSIMIAYNYCFSTCLGNITELEKAGGEEFKFGCTSLRIPGQVLSKLKKHINVSPNGVAFVKQHVRKGVISRMVEEILDTRLMVKRCMSRYKTDKGLHKLLHARQLGLKLIANVTFGYAAANFSGRMPCVEVGDSIVRKARETLERAIKMVNESEKWRCRVVYGDTDSLFVEVPGRSLAEAFKIGEEIRDAVTADNPKPIKLKLEKVYMGCVLQTKKRYAGYMYETADQKEPVYDAKGIETVRRDSIPAVSKILEKSLTNLFASRDLSLVKSYVQKQLTKILEGTAKLQDFLFAKEYRGVKGYKPTAKVPALLIAKRRVSVDRWNEPLTGERVPYVIVCGAPGTPLYNLVREPRDVLANPQLKLNTIYYVTRVVLPPLHRAFSLLGVNVQSWYEELPKVHKLGVESSTGSVKSTLPQFFSSTKCLLCEGGCQATVCHRCLTTDAQETVVALNRVVSRQLHLEHAALQICRCCSRMNSDSRVPCVSLDCPLLYKKTQLHSQRTLSASICQKYLGKINNF